ncbi:MAG: GTP-binding protein [Candidatus Asgardarchaeia archaeon]
MKAYLFKVIVIGDGMVGKTSLTLRFSQGTFREQYLMTIGVEFAIKVIKVNDSYLKLQIWDTGGQERFSHVRPLYYRGASGGLVCFDITNRTSFENVGKWIKEAKRYAGDIPFVLVGTKYDLNYQRKVNREEAMALAESYGIPFYETSAKTGYNVDAVFEELARMILHREFKK